ncbi:hypothetical protein HNR46_004213 [Haloferula luteola]|uniref:Uncharacterized protein n=1 Tax=Haloferula luteola TaxID=595692 RepID=A0A840V896_9BACT|nr:hypothetical protein [Haloferula luteola]MBB5353943.1 hypothetical protein [Haloferula luteola]
MGQPNQRRMLWGLAATVLFLMIGAGFFSWKKKEVLLTPESSDLVGIWESLERDKKANEYLEVYYDLTFKYNRNPSDVITGEIDDWPKAGKADLNGDLLSLPLRFRFPDGKTVEVKRVFQILRFRNQWVLARPGSGSEVDKGQISAGGLKKRRTIFEQVLDLFRTGE